MLQSAIIVDSLLYSRAEQTSLLFVFNLRSTGATNNLKTHADCPTEHSTKLEIQSPFFELHKTRELADSKPLKLSNVSLGDRRRGPSRNSCSRPERYWAARQWWPEINGFCNSCEISRAFFVSQFFLKKQKKRGEKKKRNVRKWGVREK